MISVEDYQTLIMTQTVTAGGHDVIYSQYFKVNKNLCGSVLFGSEFQSYISGTKREELGIVCAGVDVLNALLY